MFVELCKEIDQRDNVVSISEVPTDGAGHELYISMFPYTQDIFDYMKRNNGKVSQYKGEVYLSRIYIDIDNDDLEQSKNSTIKLIDRLCEYGVKLSEIAIFFSGKKGFHVGIHPACIGSPQPSPDIPEQMKQFCLNLTEGINDIDTKIYNHNRLFRVPNSRHRKSGLFKVPVSYEELKNKQIRHLAEEPREIEPFPKCRFNQKLHSLWNKKKLEIKKGSRNNDLFKLACQVLKSDTVNINMAKSLIHLANNGLSSPLPESEVDLLLSSAIKTTGATDSKATAVPVSELYDEWYSNMRADERPMSIGCDEFDRCMEYKLRGKLGVFIGYGGSKKSLLAQSVVIRNAELGHRSIYSTMEMGGGYLVSRFMDLSYHGGTREIIRQVEAGANAREFYLEEFSKRLKDNVLVSDSLSMTAEKYDTLIQDSKDRYGNIDLLVIDGLSMMGGRGKEVELYSQNSKELKELANKHNIMIILICHVSKGATLHTKDLSRHIRGSEKILDNCDYYASFSLLEPEENKDYERNFGAIKLVNKRGNGQDCQMFYKLHDHTLNFVFMNENPDKGF